ncbi:protein mono-ADP-ribosyltransferase PARP14-like [Haliotis rufescens]|uniref:protein mono-ADP-ribosyltransferase PARP14-like n=1 Tax=Haliotis rufescens TaxID=6454 RepID=UPI00201F1B32|nr:protein mono-ADP-ribosyltransferase PARP14-like [Haliotis rufescens]
MDICIDKQGNVSAGYGVLIQAVHCEVMANRNRTLSEKVPIDEIESLLLSRLMASYDLEPHAGFAPCHVDNDRDNWLNHQDTLQMATVNTAATPRLYPDLQLFNNGNIPVEPRQMPTAPPYQSSEPSSLSSAQQLRPYLPPVLDGIRTPVASYLATNTFPLRGPGLGDIVKSSEVQQFLKKVQLEHQCSISMEEVVTDKQNFNVHLLSGNIIHTKADVLVTSVSPDLDLNKDSLSRVVSAMAGPDLQTSLDGRYPHGVRVGDVVDAMPGRLHCSLILHACLSRFDGDYHGDCISTLRTVLLKCLQLTTQRGFKSIALPALGTGQLGYPPSTVVELLMGVYSEITSDMGSGLEVFVIVEPPKHRLFQALRGKLQEMNRIFIGREVIMIGSIQLEVILGDAKQEDADVIVYITQPGSGSTQKNTFERTPDRKSTQIYLDDPENIWSCLMEAKKRQTQSVVMSYTRPVDGSADECWARSLYHGIVKFSDERGRSDHPLNDIRLAVENIQDFVQVLLRLKTMEQMGETDELISLRNRLQPHEEAVQEFTVCVTSPDHDKIDRCIENLQSSWHILIKERKLKQSMRDITYDHKHDLKELAAMHNVHVSIAKGRMTITGTENCMLKAEAAILDRLNNFKSARPGCTWYWHKSSRLVPCGEPCSRMLEAASRSSLSLAVVKDDSGKCFTANLAAAPPVIYAFGRPESKAELVRSRDSRGNKLPAFWSHPQSGEGYRVRLAKGFEYDSVVDNLKRTLGHKCKVEKIERIQNQTLYKQYMTKAEQLQKQNGALFTNERTLWHGTSERNTALINSRGFSRSSSGHTASPYGEGCYFAVKSSHSANPLYSPPDKYGWKRMYQCRVLTGKFTLGRARMKDTPFRGQGKNVKYDSAVDDVKKPSCFVVFNDTQAYPEYLITFRIVK